MSPEDAWTYLLEFRRTLAIATSAPIIAGLWSAIADKREDDEIVSEANDLVLDMLADADAVRGVELMTDENLRDQLSVEEAIALAEDSEQRRNGWRWN